jgi:hypothetical protein
MNVNLASTTAVNMQLVKTGINHTIANVIMAGEDETNITVNWTLMSVRRIKQSVAHMLPA